MNRRTFSQELLGELFINSQLKDSNTPIIGGQSLFIWYVKYQDRVNKLGSPDEFRLAAESDDIDFLGPKEACQLVMDFISEILPHTRPDISDAIESIVPYYPDMNDSTPSSGILQIKIAGDDNPFFIDFLSTMKGLQRRADKCIETLRDDTISYTILTPLQVLKSRIANLYGLGYSDKRLENEVIRVKLASLILSEYIKDAIDHGEAKFAVQQIQESFHFAQQLEPIKLFIEYGISITKHLPVNDMRLDIQFREKNLPLIKKQLQSKIENQYRRLRSTATGAVSSK